VGKLGLGAILLLMGCGDEWGSADVGKTSCAFDEFAPSVGRPIKMAAGNSGSSLYILDDFSYVHFYKRDDLYECAFNLEYSYLFTGFPNDVLFANNSFYVQDGRSLKSQNDKEECYAKDGVFAINGNELAIGSNTGLEIWNIKPSCAKTSNISSQRIFAVAANGDYFAAEGIANNLENLTVYSKTGAILYRELLSAIPGNEKNFCSADRIAANNYGIYLLDKKCKKIGVFDNQAVWRHSISLDSLGIANSLDIAAGEHSYIFILHPNGMERVNVF
jgi:hypothetical protein